MPDMFITIFLALKKCLIKNDFISDSITKQLLFYLEEVFCVFYSTVYIVYCGKIY
jgi:hypothetical protein